MRCNPYAARKAFRTYYTIPVKPLLTTYVLALGLSIFSVIRSSQILFSQQHHNRGKLAKIINPMEDVKNEAAAAAGDRRKEHDSGSSRHFREQEDNPSCFHLDKICHDNGEWFHDNIHIDQVAAPSHNTSPAVSLVLEFRYTRRT